MVTFKYNGKIYSPANLKKKLEKLGITENGIEIINDDRIKEVIPEKRWRKNKYVNRFAGVTIWKDDDLTEEDIKNLPGNINDYVNEESIS